MVGQVVFSTLGLLIFLLVLLTVCFVAERLPLVKHYEHKCETSETFQSCSLPRPCRRSRFQDVNDTRLFSSDGTINTDLQSIVMFVMSASDSMHI